VQRSKYWPILEIATPAPLRSRKLVPDTHTHRVPARLLSSTEDSEIVPAEQSLRGFPLFAVLWEWHPPLDSFLALQAQGFWTSQQWVDRMVVGGGCRSNDISHSKDQWGVYHPKSTFRHHRAIILRRNDAAG